MSTAVKVTQEVSKNLDVGDIVQVDLQPVKGSETDKRRPCIVVSVKQMNAVSRTVTVIPVSHGTGPIMRICPTISTAQNDANIDGNIVVPQMLALDLVARSAHVIGKITDPELILHTQRVIAATLGIGASTFE